MKKFDTKVQILKYEVLREVARLSLSDTLTEHLYDIPKTIVSGNKPTMRCCVYKERAIVAERVKMAMGGNRDNPNVIEVIDIACDECPMGGFEVTEACRGCIAHRCESVCKRGAITFDQHQKAHIDKEKCVECGQCAKVCPYSAIINHKRPCENACKVKAISMNEEKTACIDNNKCLACGSCVYQCPFGAIMDKSYLLDVIQLLKEKQENRVVAIVAPSIASQFQYAKLGQVICGIEKLGFDEVVEVALGADMVAYEEAKELVEKDCLTSSCCPAFVKYVKTQFPQLSDLVSHQLSPMGKIAQRIKEQDKNVKCVFIGPCTAKKKEIQLEGVREYVDSVLTFEELQALFDASEINITDLSEAVLNQASGYGRSFAYSGGVSEAVRQALIEQNVDPNFLQPIACDGIEACRTALLKASRHNLNGNFIEGMACIGGCIGGAGCLTHGEKNKSEVMEYKNGSGKGNISEAIGIT